MKLRFIVLFTMILALLITGCSAVDMEKRILEKSEIKNDEAYKTYQELYEAGDLNEAGEYVFETGAEEDSPHAAAGQIHVTFADNRYLNIEYYKDSDETESIDEDSCFLNPGDSIYARVVGIDNPGSDSYGLAQFRIVQINEDGSRVILAENKAHSVGLVYVIENDFAGTELSVIPLGDQSKAGMKTAENEASTQPETAIETETEPETGKSFWDFITGLFNWGGE